MRVIKVKMRDAVEEGEDAAVTNGRRKGSMHLHAACTSLVGKAVGWRPPQLLLF